MEISKAMRLSSGLMAGLLVAGWLTAGCDSANNSTGSAEPTPGPSTPPSDAPTQPVPPTSAECDGSRAQWAVGQKASDDLLERARIDAGAKTARYLRPNQAVTLEYAAWRLNLGLDEQDVVKTVSCG
jgi:hypothetical protein